MTILRNLCQILVLEVRLGFPLKHEIMIDGSNNVKLLGEIKERRCHIKFVVM